MIVCFDTLTEEEPQAFVSRTCVLKQLGSGFVGDFNTGSCPLTMYCLGTGDWRPGDLDSYYSFWPRAPRGEQPLLDFFWRLFHLFLPPYKSQISFVSSLRVHYLRGCVDFKLYFGKNVSLALFKSSVLLLRSSVVVVFFFFFNAGDL